MELTILHHTKAQCLYGGLCHVHIKMSAGLEYSSPSDLLLECGTYSSSKNYLGSEWNNHLGLSEENVDLFKPSD